MWHRSIACRGSTNCPVTSAWRRSAVSRATTAPAATTTASTAPIPSCARSRDLTQSRVREIMAREYRGGRGGLPGNDDAGTMSAWFVWNAIGLYPNAGQDWYYIGSPLFTRSAIDLGEGRHFTIAASDSSPANRYVQSATLDGATLRLAHARRYRARGAARPDDARPPLGVGPKPTAALDDDQPVRRRLYGAQPMIRQPPCAISISCSISADRPAPPCAAAPRSLRPRLLVPERPAEQGGP